MHSMQWFDFRDELDHIANENGKKAPRMQSCATRGLMRLVCPNCDAQYEVDDRVMPESGREVQCSHCGRAWFQAHPDTPMAESSSPPLVETAHQPMASQPAEAISNDVDKSSDEDAKIAATVSAAIEPKSQDKSRGSDLPPQKADEDVRRILREEASRELHARQSEQAQIETQTDLGLDDATISADEDLTARIARLYCIYLRLFCPTGCPN